VSQSAASPRNFAATWVLLLGAILALVVFAQAYGDRKREKQIRPLLFANSGLPAALLSTCLAQRPPLTGRTWDLVAGNPPRVSRWNMARGMRVDIIDANAKGRRIEIATPEGRPLSEQEAEALRRCLAGG
jgi:hypothetical protein